ncbi:MAG TPA: hypothetical protein VKW78_11400 [Terriglobales bacterium]|nr:hypothetical protein [Terriglobales bacterium]
MEWRIVELRGRRYFHDAAEIHNGDAVTHPSDEPQIMRYQQDGHAVPLAELEQKVHDLGLNRYVQRCCWLIGDQEFGPAGKRHGDHHSLAQTTTKLVRIGLQHPLGVRDADFAEPMGGLFSRLVRRDRVVQSEHSAQLGSYRPDRIEA